MMISALRPIPALLAGVACTNAARSDPIPHEHPSNSFWLQDLPSSSQLPQMPKRVDVIVIGSGISGASTAHHLAQAGKQVLMLEARQLHSGATGRNGGFVHARGWQELVLMVMSKGMVGWKLVQFEQECQRQVRQFVQSYNVSCDYEESVQAMQLYETQGGLADDVGPFLALPVLRPLLRLCGVDIMDQTQCRQIINCCENSPIVCAVATKGSCDTTCSAKLAHGLLNAATASGRLQVCTDSPVVSVRDGAEPGDDLEVLTASGDTILTAHVVHATNAYVSHLLPEYKAWIRPVLNYVVAFEASAPRLLQSGQTVGMSTEPGWNYWIQRADGRVICGGFRNKRPDRGFGVFDDSLCAASTPLPAKAVAEMAKAFMADRFKGFAEASVDYVWSGIIGWSCDGLPWVGPVAGRRNQWVVAGFSGHGMTQTFLCGKAVAEMIAGGGGAPEWFVEEFLPSDTRFDEKNAFREEREGGV